LLRKLGLRKEFKPKKAGNEEAFERFRCNYLTRTRRLISRSDFFLIAAEFDAVVVGSDQVWRPEYTNDAIAYFLAYVPNGVGRVAYAASFGKATWDPESYPSLTDQARSELKKFKAISCREQSGVHICKDVFGVAAEQVLDPLLLVDQLFIDGIITRSSVVQGSKLIYYKLDSTVNFEEDLEAVSNEIGSDAVNIYLKGREFREVPDWVAFIRFSEVVLTDSYHCICLALRFGKKVIFCPNEKRGQTRLDSLFNLLNIELEPLELELKTPMYKLVAPDDIETIINKERLRSREFLIEALTI